MAYRLVEDTGVKHLPMRHSARRQALGVLLGGLFLLSLGAPQAVQADAYKQVLALAQKEVAIIPLWQDRQSVAAWENVSGIVIEPNYLLRLDRLVNR